MNRVILIGRLTKTPELRATQSGVSVCTFTLAVDRRRKADGQPEADFIPVVAFGVTADNCKKYLDKGKMCAVAGSIQIRTYDARDGSKRYVTEVIADETQFLSPKNENAENAPQNGFNEPLQNATDDDIPF